MLGLLLAAGCGPQATPTYFVPPTMAPQSLPAPPLTAEASSPTTVASPVPTLAPPSPTPPCADGLTYLQDLTIPDGSIVVPGQLIDKRWQVSTSGTCTWAARYRLTHVGGDAMGAATSLPLYPARAGAEATISILFTAPQAAGTYESQWQAVNPDGVPFGSAFYMQVVVSP
jgi:hypothetical protein